MGVCEPKSKKKNTITNKTPALIQKEENNAYFKIYNNSQNNNNIENNDMNVLNQENVDEINIPKKKEYNDNDQIIVSSEQSEKVTRQLKQYICKIIIGQKLGTGFLCKIPFPYESNCLPVLMTNHHVINKEKLLENKKLDISFNNDQIKKIINISSERKIYSNKKYDLTIIEIYQEMDGIFHFFELETLDKINKNSREPIYVLQYPGGNECSVSYGKLCDIQDFEIYHDCSTKKGSSGGPILLLRNFKLIGIHKGYLENFDYNIGSSLLEPIKEFNSTFYNKNIINKNRCVNCIICEYEVKNGEEFDLLHDYSKQILDVDDNLKLLYNEGKKKKSILEENVNIYIENELINFKFKYKTHKNIIKARFIFKEIINDLSFLFYECKNLKLVDMSAYDAIKVNNMSYMFSGCSSLKSIDFFLFNTDNVTNMSNMFSECQSLQTMDLSSFNTHKVINMEKMFLECSSIIRLDLTSFNTINVINMSKMFANCYSLKFFYLSKLKTNNVMNMEGMFSRCSSIRSLNLSSFDTSKVENMDGMFEYCSTLESLNVTTFNTINVKNMKMMFQSCPALKSLDLSSFNTMNVENMLCIFGGDTFLEYLDLSSFNTTNIKNMIGMFTECINLKTVKCKDNNILKAKNSIHNLFK